MDRKQEILFEEWKKYSDQCNPIKKDMEETEYPKIAYPAMETYAKERVIEELERMAKRMISRTDRHRVGERINQLKQQP